MHAPSTHKDSPKFDPVQHREAAQVGLRLHLTLWLRREQTSTRAPPAHTVSPSSPGKFNVRHHQLTLSLVRPSALFTSSAWCVPVLGHLRILTKGAADECSDAVILAVVDREIEASGGATSGVAEASDRNPPVNQRFPTCRLPAAGPSVGQPTR